MISQSQYRKYATTPSAFRSALVVDVDGIARPLGEVMDPWQQADFAALDPALLRCSGQSKATPRMRAYLERPRGHSKTTDLAVMAVWALAFATRPLRGYCYAADRDQARLLRDAMGTIVRLNPWIGELLSVEAHRVVNVANGHPAQGGTLTIEASDVGSSYGILPDLIIADELTHWQGDGGLWHSLISSAAKRSNCLLVTISNAGFCDSWQWAVREAARNDPAWIFSRLDGPKASWMSPERLAEQRRMLPTIAYLRLWENQWSSGGGDALTPADIDACFLDGLTPMCGNEKGWLFVGGVDLGLTRDCSAVVVLAVPDKRYGKIRLAYNRLWRPTLGKKVDLMEVERTLLDLDRQFHLEQIGFDPWQSELLASRIEANSQRRRRNQRRRLWAQPFMKEIVPSAANLREQATLTIEVFQDHRLELYECEPLRYDLLKLRVEEKSYGIRLVSPRDDQGHGDSFSAFSMALLLGHELGNKRPTVVGAVQTARGLTPIARAIARHEARAEAYAQEMQFLSEAGADYSGQEGWAQAMRRAGRL